MSLTTCMGKLKILSHPWELLYVRQYNSEPIFAMEVLLENLKLNIYYDGEGVVNSKEKRKV